MWFRNLCIYRLGEPFDWEADAMEERLTQFAFQPVPRSEMSSRGWVSPLGRQGSTLVHAAGRQFMVCLQEESRVLPPAVIRETLEQRVAEREDQEFRELGRREKARMKDEITLELLPRAFTKSRRTHAWIDARNGWVVVDTATWKDAEDVTELLRACLGSLPLRPLQSDVNPQTVMTGWLSPKRPPQGIELGEEAVLEDPQSEGAEVRVKRQDLQSPEMQAHIKAGKRIRRLAVTWDERLNAVLDADLSVKRLKFLDVVQDDAGDREPESAAERFDADFAIMSLELGRFLPRMVELFGGEAKSA
jgi:recombination associated protein RdgC